MKTLGTRAKIIDHLESHSGYIRDTIVLIVGYEQDHYVVASLESNALFVDTWVCPEEDLLFYD